MAEEGQRLARPGEQVKGRYIRSTQARVIHVDGAFGGITNNLHVHMALFSEHHLPAAEIVVTQQAGGGLVEAPAENTESVNFVREVEADLMLTPGVAQALHKWLEDRLDEIRVATEQLKQVQGK